MILIEPQNKLFIVSQGTSSVDVHKELYMRWKEWVNEDIFNLRYSPAFLSTGGESISVNSNQVSPRYFFLINNWKVKLQNARVQFSYNLYSEDGTSPFVLINSEVQNDCSDVGIVSVGDGTSGTSTSNPLDDLLINHLREGSFGELLQKTFLASSK